MLFHRIGNRPPNPNGGSLIFALQVLLVVLVPLLDDGKALAPPSYVAALIAAQAGTVSLLGYRRTAAAISLWGTLTLSVVAILGFRTSPMRLVLWATLISGGATTVALTLKSAFAAGVPPVQRIFCGAAGYVMLGFVFAALHGLAGYLLQHGFLDQGAYLLQTGVERSRPIHWPDYVWLSFATLTTAGFGDVVAVGSLPSALATLEAVAGILFPATLIARIASLADAERRP